MSIDTKNTIFTDYDRIADRLEDVMETLLTALRDTPNELQGGGCRLINTDLFVDSLAELKHLHSWVEKLADSHRESSYVVTR